MVTTTADDSVRVDSSLMLSSFECPVSGSLAIDDTPPTGGRFLRLRQLESHAEACVSRTAKKVAFELAGASFRPAFLLELECLEERLLIWIFRALVL